MNRDIEWPTDMPEVTATGSRRGGR